jgi:hypothetical protein
MTSNSSAESELQVRVQGKVGTYWSGLHFTMRGPAIKTEELQHYVEAKASTNGAWKDIAVKMHTSLGQITDTQILPKAVYNIYEQGLQTTATKAQVTSLKNRLKTLGKKARLLLLSFIVYWNL